MNRFFVFIAIFSSFLLLASADSKDQKLIWRCYVGSGDNPPFFIPERILFETFNSSEPEFKYATNQGSILLENMIGINWVKLSTNTTVSHELLGVYEGRKLFSFTYLFNNLQRDNLDCLMLAIEENPSTNSTNIYLRPFFIISGDESIRNWDASLTASKEYPMLVNIGIDIDGNGMYHSDWDVAMTTIGPRLVGYRDGGRKCPSTTIRYNTNGKIIFKETDPYRLDDQ